MSLKLLASISNIFLYTIFVIVFLGFGDFPTVPWQNNIIVIETLTYVFVFVSFVFLGMYQVLHTKEIKKSGFVMQKKHFLFQNIFYYSEYFILLVTFLYALLTQTVPFTSTTVRILFYIFFPLFFVVSSVTSVLESIVRVEIKIYKSKEIWAKSALWEKQQQKKAHINHQKNPFLHESVQKEKPPRVPDQ